MLVHQSELAKSKSLADANPSALPLQFAYAQSLEKMWRFAGRHALQTQVSPFAKGIEAVNSLTQGQLNSGPKLVKTAAYEAAVKLYDDSERLRNYWVTQLIERETYVNFAERKTYAADALKIYKNLIQKDPNNLQWQAAYVNAYIHTLGGQRQSVHDNFQPSLDLILRLIEENPKDIPLQRTLAAIYAAKGALLVQSTSDRGFVQEWHNEIGIRVTVLNKQETDAHRAELATALERNAQYFNIMGGGERAFFALTDTKKLMEIRIQNDPGNADLSYDLMRINRALADVRDQYKNQLKKAQPIYLAAIESSMRAAKESPREIEAALANVFKNHEETVELVYLNVLNASQQLLAKRPFDLRAQRALVESYADLGKFYADRNDNNAQAIKIYTQGAEHLSELAAQNPSDVAWIFYQLELNIALGFAYAKEIKAARSEKERELRKPIPGYELKAEKDIRYIAKVGSELKGIENEPAHRRHAAALNTSDAIYAKVLKLVEAALSKTPASIKAKSDAAFPKRREF